MKPSLLKIPRYLDFYMCSIACAVFTIVLLCVRAEYAAVHQQFPVWWLLSPIALCGVFWWLYQRAKKKLVVLAAFLGIQEIVLAGWIVGLFIIGGIVLLAAIGGCGLKKGIEKVKEIERQRERAMTNAEEIVMISVPLTNQPVIAVAEPLPKAHTMRSDDMHSWVKLDDERDLITIAREASQQPGAPAVQFFRRGE